MHHSLDQYRLAFEISPVPMLLVSPSGEITLANERLNQLFGYGSGDLIGKSVELLIPDKVRQHHPQLRSAYFRVPTKRGMGVGRDLHGKTRAGDIVPLELALEPIVIGDATWAMVAAVDIRQRKAHEDRLRQAMDASATAMVMTDDQGLVVLVNTQAVSMFGYQQEELIGSPVEVLIPTPLRQAHAVYRNSYNIEGVARAMGAMQTLSAIRRDGSQFPVEIALTPVNSNEGRIVMSTIIDLTDRVEAERLMALRAKELEALNEELSLFAYSASHDLKAPLITITGLLDACMEDLDDGNLDDLRANLLKTKAISQRSAEKVEGVLQIARAGNEPIASELIELESFVRNIWNEQLCNHGPDIELALDLNHSQPVNSERPTLHVILENLISNALRYRDTQKATSIITVTTTSEKNQLHVCVSDNGLGIAESNQHLVFKMFKRINEHSGNGLGLALVKKHVERLNGSINFKSEEGAGTEFKFTIPLSR